MPFTPPTSPFCINRDIRATWNAHVKVLNEAVALADHPDATVMATDRVAAHLLTVRRLENISDAVVRRDLFATEAGEGKSWMEAFEWFVLDRIEPQGDEDQKDLIDSTVSQAQTLGYEVVFDKDDVIVLQRSRLPHETPRKTRPRH